MTQLSEKKCVPCEGNVSAFDYSEIHKYLKKVNGWEVKQNDKKNYYLEKNFKFIDKRPLNISMNITKIKKIKEENDELIIIEPNKTKIPNE